MNKIFKVIWSKTRNCYVVASELAKGTSKSTSTGRMAKRAALAAVAALLISPLGAGYVSAADADYVTVKDSSGTGHTVYTKDGVDAQLGEYAKNSDISDLKAKTEAIIYDKDSKTVMVDGKLTATKGITDGTTTQKGQYVKADNYVGQNLNALSRPMLMPLMKKHGNGNTRLPIWKIRINSCRPISIMKLLPVKLKTTN